MEGLWKSDPNDIITQQHYGDVILEFKNNNQLIYTIHEEDKEQKTFMTYEVQGNFLITDQPSLPQKEQTEFSFNEKETVLTLTE